MNNVSTGSPPAATVRSGRSPVVLAFPHAGTWLPSDCNDALNAIGRTLSDTDWHVDRLYADLLADATTVTANAHRYLIDCNRDPAGQSLYPGENTTGLVPMTDFDGQPIWREPPDADTIERRRQDWHAPYHTALEAELQRVQAEHGIVILFDCHSIRSRIPYLFEGTLPDFNIGTDSGRSCAPELEAIVRDHCQGAAGYTTVVNGRFRGGWTTRHYGQPLQGRHAVQLELAQSTYLEEHPPWTWQADRADRLRAVLGPMLQALAEAAPGLRG